MGEKTPPKKNKKKKKGGQKRRRERGRDRRSEFGRWWLDIWSFIVWSFIVWGSWVVSCLIVKMSGGGKLIGWRCLDAIYVYFAAPGWWRSLGVWALVRRGILSKRGFGCRQFSESSVGWSGLLSGIHNPICVKKKLISTDWSREASGDARKSVSRFFEGG